MRSTLIALALLAAPAHALQPEGLAVAPGIEPQRIFRDHPQVQARLAGSDAFAAFQAEHPDWTARFDEVTGAPRRLWGGPIPMPASHEGALVDALIAELDHHADLLRFEAGTLVLREARYVERLDTWYVDFETPRDGVPVWRGGITARVKQGNLVMIGALAYGDRPTAGSWQLDADRAIDRAIALGPVPGIKHTDTTARRIWLPVEGVDGLQLVATWLVTSRTTEVPGKWVSFVDAETGALRSVHNEVRFFDGTVSGWHHPRTPDGTPMVLSPLADAVVSDGVDVVTTGADGRFTLPDGGEYTTTLDGAYARVINDLGAEGSLVSSGDLLWTDESATQAEISSYVFLHQVRDWGLTVAPEVRMVEGPVVSTVNLTDNSCNAYFDGTVNFYAAADGCVNTALIGDVNYHEWGHGFHLYSVSNTWYGFDGSLSEGAADTVAFFLTGDNHIAPHFFNNGGEIRDVAPNRTYPDDYTDSDQAVHSNGLIFGGAMWDMWNLLIEEEGQDQGTATAEAIFAGLLKGGPGVADAYDEAILADDDDGNLANGTPHECLLIEAFGQHGLGPLGNGGSSQIATYLPQAQQIEASEPFALELQLRSAAPNCFDIAPTSGAVHYQVDGGDWQTAALSVQPDGATGEIPAQPAGSIVQYWVQVDDENGGSIRLPAGADINPYSYYVGPTLEIWCNDFDSNRGGLKHELVAGQEAEGADDWQWGVPAGAGGDPSAAYSGQYVWGNDLGWNDFNGQYQDDKHNRLYTPSLDTAHYLGAVLTYQRWLTIEDGVWDVARIAADGETVWSNVEGTPDVGGKDHIDRDWSPHVVSLGEAGDDGSLVLEWSIQSDGGVTFGGWNLDDVCVVAPDTADNRLGISGIEAKPTEAGVELSWIQPRHAPVRSVYVLRNDDHLPTGPDDGERVWSTRNIDLGERISFVDTDAPRWDAWYAVYATNDTTALSWTREGFNAAFVAGDGPAPEQDGVLAGCGCATDATPTGTGWLAGLALLAYRRRR